MASSALQSARIGCSSFSDCDKILPVQVSVKIRLAAAGTALLLLTSAYYRTQAIPIMTDAANAFLSSLTPDQQAKAKFPFDSEERYNWHFIPRERKGLPVKDMSPFQKN